ncbi:hypothetical protein A3758_16285 [Oleiphilus sp. HI0118]|nr:hypothetical protein A3758_16285 [Oleiphilus sp. HI0118]
MLTVLPITKVIITQYDVEIIMLTSLDRVFTINRNIDLFNPTRPNHLFQGQTKVFKIIDYQKTQITVVFGELNLAGNGHSIGLIPFMLSLDRFPRFFKLMNSL